MRNLTKYINSFSNTLGIKFIITDYAIDITITKISSIYYKPEIKSILYRLLNNYEKDYFITINGLPYCLMPDAEEHVIYTKNSGLQYAKLSICKDCKFITACPGIPKEEKTSSLPGQFIESLSPVLDLPKEIVIEVNKNCNLRCPVCFAREKQKGIGQPAKKIKNIIDEAHSLGVKDIRFTGGEPFLRKDTVDLLKHAKAKGFYVLLNTNATLLTQKRIDEFQGYVDNILISMQGCDKLTEEKLTKKGVLWKNKLNNIAKLQMSKIPTLRIGTIISTFLIYNLSKYHKLIKSLGVSEWDLYRPIFTKAIYDRHRYFDISQEQIRTILDFSDKLRLEGINVKIANAMPLCITKSKARHLELLGARYDDGHARIIFDAKGFFKPSYFINKNLGENIKAAWHHPFLKKMRSLSYLPNSCRKCNDLKWCYGGSRFWAKEYFGSYFDKDPWMRIQ